MTGHTVKQVAKLSGVSVRTLHHYDEIGLLKPANVGLNGYRYYGREELLRLQQILFHRELGLALEDIRRLLDAPGFDRVAALRAHRTKLAADIERYGQLMRTIDETLAALDGERAMEDKAMYRGFDPEKQAKYEAWIVDRYPAMQRVMDASKALTKTWKQADFDSAQHEMEAVESGMANALTSGLPVDSDHVQSLVRRLSVLVSRYWTEPVTGLGFVGLANLYGEHPDFRARYETRAAGLTEYLQAAMRAFAEKDLT
ncbi:MAG: MerR family transcriptional regulator [Phenylobacterium sp.]